MKRFAVLPRSVTRTTFYAQPPEKVWKALTERELLSRWLLPVSTDIRPEPGFRFRFQSEEGMSRSESIACQVMEAEPGRHLSFTWQTAADQPPTFVTWTLEPTDGGTLLHLEHEGPMGPMNALGAGGGSSDRLLGLFASAEMTETVEIIYGGFRSDADSLCGGKFADRRAVVRYLFAPAQRPHYLHRGTDRRRDRQFGGRTVALSGKAGCQRRY